MNSAIGKIRARLSSLGYTEATVTKQGDRRIRVEIPSVSNPEEAEAMLGTTGKIRFVDYQENVLMDGTDEFIKKAEYAFSRIDEYSGAQPHVKLSFTDAGQKAFKEATEKVMTYDADSRVLFIMLDDTVISYPTVNKVIDDNAAIITYGNDADRKMVQEQADIINSGRLPFELKSVESQSIGATLGEKALSSSLMAGLIGVILILLIMLLIYRLPGLMACIALLAYIGIALLVFTILRVNLSLPGIAGIILSIGMAIDANIIIFERVREELALGKSVSSAVNAGFKNAFSAIFDSNVTTLFAVLALYWKGTGPIQGFAVTLGLGVVISMLTAITLTRFLLNLMIRLEIKNPKWYGLKALKEVKNV